MIKRIIALILILSLVLPWSVGSADDKLIYVLCDPESYVNVRKTPKLDGEKTGWLLCGDSVMTDGKKKNHFLHVYGITEDGEGWVHIGFVVDDKPVVEEGCHASIAANGKVRARWCIGGRRAAWLEVCDDVNVLARSDEWTVTNRGFIKTEYLELWYE